jgi:hypothetical protein
MRPEVPNCDRPGIAPCDVAGSIGLESTINAARVGPASAPEEQVAYVHVRVSPPQAEISFEGSKTAQIGSSRLYVSPPLVPGENYRAGNVLHPVPARWPTRVKVF